VDLGPEERVKHESLYKALSVAVLALSIVPIGGAVFVLGFGFGDSPCVMCWEQRIGMVLIALNGVFILRYGPRPRYVGMSVLVATWGIFMGLRHTAMHAARDIGQGFSLEVLGAHTYTWAVFIYWVCLLLMAALLLMLGDADFSGVPRAPRALRRLDTLAVYVFLIVVAANVVQAFASTGPPPFVGQSDPVRFSFNPRHWVWSLDEWSFAPISLRGRWAVGEPDLAQANGAAATGPFAGLPTLPTLQQRKLALPLRGKPTGLAYDQGTDRFLLTTERGVYVVDGSLHRVLRSTMIDPGFSVDLDGLTGTAFLDSRTVMAVSENKSYIILRENDRSSADRNFRYFLESFDRFDEVSRGRLSTVRARLMYTMSLAFDPAAQSLYTLTVPNAKSRRLVVSRFDRGDLTLSEEFVPQVPRESGLKFRAPDRSVDDLFVSAATFHDGRLYALSAAHGTLLVIDSTLHAVVAAYTLPGVNRPKGIAVKGDELYVVCDDGTLLTVQKPGETGGVPSHQSGR
jgi:disulfide bond formation protein DsbB